jgi:hypothetical protein
MEMLNCLAIMKRSLKTLREGVGEGYYTAKTRERCSKRTARETEIGSRKQDGNTYQHPR